MKFKQIFSALLLSSLIIGAGVKASNESQRIEYARCLKEKGATLYTVDWCPHCRKQKQALGPEVLEIVDNVDCEENRKVCRSKGIRAYPTWLLPDGTEIPPGDIEDLAAAVGCNLGENM